MPVETKNDNVFTIKTNRLYQDLTGTLKIKFTAEEIAVIEIAEKVAANFPYPGKWHGLPHQYKRAYYERQVWAKEAKGPEPELMSIRTMLETISEEDEELVKLRALNEITESLKLATFEKLEKESGEKDAFKKVDIKQNESRIPQTQTPQLIRKNPVFPRSNSSSSLFKQKQAEPIYHSPLYIGNDIYLKTGDSIDILGKLDAEIKEKLIKKPAVSSPGYDRIYSLSPTALKILKAELDKGNVDYKVLGSKSNSSNFPIFNSPIVSRR